jgi:hypothetical protein
MYGSSYMFRHYIAILRERWFFTHIFTGDFNFKGLTAQRRYKSFGVKNCTQRWALSYAEAETFLYVPSTFWLHGTLGPVQIH